tara:strand:+ start:939 stop:2312 length:1374 start_codon:yes stop_codon:yes gene_type:complete
MSGFDNLRKTDAHIAQVNQFYDAQRYQSDRATAEAIGKIPGQMQQSQMNQQAMEQQKLQGALREKTVEANLRAQEAAMEQQFHTNKMQQLLMADTVQGSHEDVRMKTNQNVMTELAIAEKKKSASTENQTKKTKYIGEAVSRLGAGAAARAMGQIPYMGESGWRLRKADSPEELEKFIKENPRASDGYATSRANRESRIVADREWDMAKEIEAKYQNRFGETEWPNTPRGEEDRAEYERLRARTMSFYKELGGSGQEPSAPDQGSAPMERHPASSDRPPGMAPQAPGAPEDNYGPPAPMDGPPSDLGSGQPEQFTHQDMMGLLGPVKKAEAPTLSPGAIQQANSAYAHAQRDPQWREMAGAMGERSFALMAAGVGVAAEDLVKSGRMTADRASQVVMQSIMDGGSESAMYLSLAGYSEPQIRAWLGRNNRESAVNSIMDRLNAHLAKRKSERKGQNK